jgi:hypothetical protein
MDALQGTKEKTLVFPKPEELFGSSVRLWGQNLLPTPPANKTAYLATLFLIFLPRINLKNLMVSFTGWIALYWPS